VRASSTPAKRKGIPLTPLKLPTVLTIPEVDQLLAAIRKPALRCFFWTVYCLLIRFHGSSENPFWPPPDGGARGAAGNPQCRRIFSTCLSADR
jgi:hypothetical protein